MMLILDMGPLIRRGLERATLPAEPLAPAREAGANAYLTKPYQEVELIEQVGDLLDMELVPGRAD